MSISAFAEAQVSEKRISAFLCLPELPHRRRILKDPSIPIAIAVHNGCFLWTPEQPLPTLRDVTVNIKHGSLTAVIGLVGAGKSSLIAALLGEMLQVDPCDFSKPAPDDDQVFLNGTIAYVSQEAWIQNDTVKVS